MECDSKVITRKKLFYFQKSSIKKHNRVDEKIYDGTTSEYNSIKIYSNTNSKCMLMLISVCSIFMFVYYIFDPILSPALTIY